MTTNTININDTFFEGIYKDIWRKLIPNGLSEAECDFIQDVAALDNNNKVLDLMCGYGRHALELARRGFQVTAVDNSTDYISEIKSVTSVNSLPVEAFASGALEMNLEQQYKAILCMGNSFAFFNREEAVLLLHKIARALLQDGVFIINSWMIAEIAIRLFREKEWYEVDGYKYLLDYQFHFQPSRIESEHTIIGEGGIAEVIKGVDYIFTIGELESMFNEAGLKTLALYSTPRKRPFKMGDNKIYIVVGKR
jgi:SAM-dependent methyltransferase